MRFVLTVIILFAALLHLKGQATIVEGEVSYVSSRNVYVKFRSTADIQIGDTLFLKHGAIVTPAILVTSKSSISCVGVPLFQSKLKVSDPIVSRSYPLEQEIPDELILRAELPPDEQGDEVEVIEKVEEEESISIRKQKVRGRLSASSYSNMASESSNNTQRMRYSFSMQADHIDQSRFSTQTFISFRHKTNEKAVAPGELFDHLKIYSLAVKYDVSEMADLWIGRKTNFNLSNMGAIDGLQFEKRFSQFSFGSVFGFRPDYEDYGVNLNLLQIGAYLSHESHQKKGRIKSTLALVEQKNNGNTDRRFAYFQHRNSLTKNLNLFTSFEVSLFENVDNKPHSTFDLSGVYLSLRYRASRKLSFFGSYDARKNVIYYESFKSYIDQLIDQETRQGFRMRINYRPIKFLSLGMSGGYRMQKNNPNTSKNFRGNVTYSRVPIIKSSATVNVTLLQSGYMEGRIIGIRLTRDIIRGKVSGTLNYRKVHYKFISSDSFLNQDIFGVNLSWRIQKRLSLSVNYEGNFERLKNIDRVRVNLTKRFQ